MTATISTPSTRLRVDKITARIGARITGVDITGDLDPDTVTQLRQALNEHKALVFHDAVLDDAGQERFARHFGDLTKAHPTVPSLDGSPNVLPVDSEQGRANHWHTDVTFVLNPPQASTLRSITVPPYGGETLIANTAATPIGGAFANLPDGSIVVIGSNSYEVDYEGGDGNDLTLTVLP